MNKNVKINLLKDNSLISNIKKNYRKNYKKALSGEAAIQKAVIEYIKHKYPDVLYCASAGGVRTSMKQAIKMKVTGYVKGVPDLQIMESTDQYHGLFIEIKDIKGVVSKEQKEWIKKLNERNYYATYCRGYDECINIIDGYFEGKI